MTRVPYPHGIRRAAAQFGVDLGTHAEIGRRSRFGFEIKARATVDSRAVASGFTAPPTETRSAAAIRRDSAPLPPIIPAATAAAATRAAFDPNSRTVQGAFNALPPRNLVVQRPVVFTIPIAMTGNPTAALAAADKLLSDPNIKNGQQVVQNTISLVKLDHPEIRRDDLRRGAAVLDAAIQIREEMGALPNEPAIVMTTPSDVLAADLVMQNAPYTLSDGDMYALETALAEVGPSTFTLPGLEPKSLWQRFLDWVIFWD